MSAGALARFGRVELVVEQLRRAVPGGIGTYACGLLAGLAAIGAREPLRIELYASRPPAQDPDPLERFGFAVRASALPGPLLTRLWDAGLRRAPAGASVVHAVSLAAPPSRAPLSVAVHDLAWRSVPEAYPRHGRRWHEAALRRAVRRAALLVTPSEQVAAALRASGLRVLAERVVVIEPGADHLVAPDETAAELVLARLGVGGPFLLTVSTLEPRKNLDRLCAAYARVRRELPEPWPLVVAGPAGWGSALGPVPEGVVFAGRVGDAVLSALYRRARLVAYVPLEEGYGLPVVEAMRAGVPVVATAVPAAGGAAREVAARDVDSIAAGLLAVGGDDAERDRLVAAGRARVAPLTWEAAASAHLAAWRALAGA